MNTKFPQNKGQSVTEYAVIISLVAVVAIGGLIAMQDMLKQNFMGMNTGTKQSIASVRAAALSSRLVNASTTSQGSLSAQAGTSALLSNTNSQAEAAGSMGNTNGVVAGMNTLSSQALQLRLDPNADPQVVQLVSQLANAGRTYGNTLFQSMSLFGSKSPTLAQDTSSAQAQLVSGYTQLAAYLQNHPNALPEANKNTINTAVVNIVPDALKDSMIANIAAAQATAARPGTAATATGINVTTSQSANHDANTICQNGGNASQCVTSTSSNANGSTASNVATGSNSKNASGNNNVNSN